MPADSPKWVVEETRSGEFTAYFNGRALHSKFDPVREAEKAAAAIPNGTGIVVLAGLGLGYVAEAILRQAPGRPLIVAEADEEAPARAAGVRDVTALLRRPEVTLLTGGKPSDVRAFLTGGPVGASIHFLPWRPATQSNPEWYASLEAVVRETSRRRQVNANTLERFGNLWIRNLAANRSILPNAISVDAGKNAFQNIPALILAGGPSLEEALPHLEALSRSFMLIAVDTALKAVLSAGTRPDVIVAVDPQYWNTRHLDWCRAEAKEALILAETATHPAVFRKLAGRPIMTRTRFPLGEVLENAVGLQGELNAGGSVATAAWDLARHFGCQPLIAAGLDLGFPGRRTHYAGSLSRERPHLFSSRIAPAQSAFFHALNVDGSLREVRDMAGRPLLTDQRMDIYHAWFTENILELTGRNPGVLGGRGRYIEGMRQVTMGEILGMKECRPEIDKAIVKLNGITPKPSAQRELRAALRELTAALNRLRALASKGMKAAVEASSKVREGGNPGKQLTVMSEVDAALMSETGLSVVSFLMQPLILEVTLSAKDGTDPLEVSKRLYTKIVDSASYHLRFLQGHEDCAHP